MSLLAYLLNSAGWTAVGWFAAVLNHRLTDWRRGGHDDNHSDT